MIGREAIQCVEHQEVGVSMANNITFGQERGRLPQQRYSAPRFRPSALIQYTQRGEVKSIQRERNTSKEKKYSGEMKYSIH